LAQRISENINFGGCKRVLIEVFSAVKVHIVVFWVMTPCSLVGDYQSFGLNYCRLNRDADGSMLQH
jgi:hypothetical protein